MRLLLSCLTRRIFSRPLLTLTGRRVSGTAVLLGSCVRTPRDIRRDFLDRGPITASILHCSSDKRVTPFARRTIGSRTSSVRTSGAPGLSATDMSSRAMLRSRDSGLVAGDTMMNGFGATDSDRSLLHTHRRIGPSAFSVSRSVQSVFVRRIARIIRSLRSFLPV